MSEITAKMPWANNTGGVPLHLEYFQGSMYDKVEAIAKQYPDNIAFTFMGKNTTYKAMLEHSLLSAWATAKGQVTR